MEQGFIQLLVEAKFDRDAGRWVAGSRQLGVFSQGDSPQEALKRSVEAITLFLSHESELGRVEGILETAGVKFVAYAPRLEHPVKDLVERLRGAFDGYTFPVTIPYPKVGAAAC